MLLTLDFGVGEEVEDLEDEVEEEELEGTPRLKDDLALCAVHGWRAFDPKDH